MTEKEIVEEIKLELTGDLDEMELEIDDNTIANAIKKSLRELQRYWDEMAMVTIPYASCIDLTGTPLEDASSITKVYRIQGQGVSSDANVMSDPVMMQQWMIFSNAGTMYNLQDYVMNYAAWSTLSQVRNTLSTDMAFTEDKHNHKLYINNTLSAADFVTVQYIPKLHEADDIKSDYWQDILVRMSLDHTKIMLGRIRTRFNLSNSIWTLDGEKMLEEGTTDLKELREILRTNSNLVMPID